MDIYLDIETDWHRGLTVVGFLSQGTGVVQVVGEEITAARLLEALPNEGRLFTYNGHSFDLPCIRAALALNLRDRFDSIDLRYVCQGNGLTGGQKAIEETLGMRRNRPDLCGRDAIRLWNQHQRGDAHALRTLLEYNVEDLYGLMLIKEYAERSRWIAPLSPELPHATTTIPQDHHGGGRLG